MDLHIFSSHLNSHAPRQVRWAAISLYVHKVSPASGNLPDQKAKGTDVCQGRKGNLFIPCHQPGNEDPGNNPPIDRQTTVTGGQTSRKAPTAIGVAIEVRIEKDVIEPRPDDSTGSGKDNHVQNVIGFKTKLFSLGTAKGDPEEKTQRNDNAVPIDVKGSNGEGDPVEMKG